jgi:hypothetical protein
MHSLLLHVPIPYAFTPATRTRSLSRIIIRAVERFIPSSRKHKTERRTQRRNQPFSPIALPPPPPLTLASCSPPARPRTRRRSPVLAFAGVPQPVPHRQSSGSSPRLIPSRRSHPRAVRFAYGWTLPLSRRPCAPLLVHGNKRAGGR